MTHGSRGATVYADGRAEHVPAFALEADPTGAGDAFCDLVPRRARRRASLRSAAARRATAVVASVLAAARDRARRHRRRGVRGRPRDRGGRAGRARSSPRAAPSLNLPARRRGGRGRLDGRRGRRRPAADARLARRRHDLARVGARPAAGPRGRDRRRTTPTCSSYAARNRLYVSRNGGVFWTALGGRAARDRGGRDQGILNSPRATVTAQPPTRTRSIVLRRARRRCA